MNPKDFELFPAELELSINSYTGEIMLLYRRGDGKELSAIAGSIPDVLKAMSVKIAGYEPAFEIQIDPEHEENRLEFQANPLEFQKGVIARTQIGSEIISAIGTNWPMALEALAFKLRTRMRYKSMVGPA